MVDLATSSRSSRVARDLLNYHPPQSRVLVVVPECPRIHSGGNDATCSCTDGVLEVRRRHI